jgi:hypothetical protein
MGKPLDISTLCSSHADAHRFALDQRQLHPAPVHSASVCADTWNLHLRDSDHTTFRENCSMRDWWKVEHLALVMLSPRRPALIGLL